MTPHRPIATFLVALLTLVGLGALAGPATASDDADEWAFVALVNESRAQAGLAPLAVLSGLRDVARSQSVRMAQQVRLQHNPDLAGQVGGIYPDWLRIGENVGQGGDVAGLHRAFMNSPDHRANVLGDYGYFAVGVVHADGFTWVTENFLKASPGKPALTPTPAAPLVPVTRIAGPTGTDTSLAVSRQFPGGQSEGVVVGRPDVFADALSGAPLAAAVHGPVLLASAGPSLPAVVAEAVRVLAPGGTVYLLGGPEALPVAVEQAFAAAGLTVARLGGADRFATAVAVARRVNPRPSEVFLVSGAEFADALAVGPAAGLRSAPVVLAAPDRLPEVTAGYLAGLAGAHVTVVGGPAAVPDAIAAAAGATARVAGIDRYETSVRVAGSFFPGASRLSFATGSSFPDALAGAAWAARAGVPLVLVSPSPGPSTRTFVQAAVGGVEDTVVFGTGDAVSDDTVRGLFG